MSKLVIRQNLDTIFYHSGNLFSFNFKDVISYKMFIDSEKPSRIFTEVVLKNSNYHHSSPKVIKVIIRFLYARFERLYYLYVSDRKRFNFFEVSGTGSEEGNIKTQLRDFYIWKSRK